MAQHYKSLGLLLSLSQEQGLCWPEQALSLNPMAEYQAGLVSAEERNLVCLTLHSPSPQLPPLICSPSPGLNTLEKLFL